MPRRITGIVSGNPSGTSSFFYEMFWKIQAVVKAQRICYRRNGEVRVLKQIACLFQAKVCQIFFWGLPQYCFKRAEQMTSADTHIVCNVFHGNCIGVIGRNIFNSFLDITVGRIAASGGGCAVQKQCQHGIETTGHFHSMFKFVASCIIDMKNLPVNGIAGGRICDDGMGW